MKQFLLAGTYLTVAVFAEIYSSSPAYAKDAELTARGLVRSTARVEIGSDLSAIVTYAGLVEGKSFKRGDRLLSFDCRRHKAELNSARAAYSAASIELKDKKNLYQNGAAGKSEVRLARAKVNRSDADVKALKARMNYCTIAAPFDGKVVALNVRSHEMPSPNEALMVIMNDRALELELVVPSSWLKWLNPKQKFQFTVDETGLSYTAKVDRLAAEVDPVSQTIKTYGTLDGELTKVLAGMSGVATFVIPGS